MLTWRACHTERVSVTWLCWMLLLLLQKNADDCHVTRRSGSRGTSVLLAGKYVHITAAVRAFRWVSHASLAHSTWVEWQRGWSTRVLEPRQCIFSTAADRLGFALYYLAPGHLQTGTNSVINSPVLYPPLLCPRPMVEGLKWCCDPSVHPSVCIPVCLSCFLILSPFARWRYACIVISIAFSWGQHGRLCLYPNAISRGILLHCMVLVIMSVWDCSTEYK